jgi:hypothetical protein
MFWFVFIFWDVPIVLAPMGYPHNVAQLWRIAAVFIFPVDVQANLFASQLAKLFQKSYANWLGRISVLCFILNISNIEQGFLSCVICIFYKPTGFLPSVFRSASLYIMIRAIGNTAFRSITQISLVLPGFAIA